MEVSDRKCSQMKINYTQSSSSLLLSRKIIYRRGRLVKNVYYYKSFKRTAHSFLCPKCFLLYQIDEISLMKESTLNLLMRTRLNLIICCQCWRKIEKKQKKKKEVADRLNSTKIMGKAKVKILNEKLVCVKHNMKMIAHKIRVDSVFCPKCNPEYIL